MNVEPVKDPSDAPSNQTDQIMDEEEMTPAQGCVGQPEGANSVDQRGHTADVDADMDLGEGTSSPASGEPSGSEPVPSANEPKPKSAFVKIMELEEVDMLKAYMGAFFGKSWCLTNCPLSVVQVNLDV